MTKDLKIWHAPCGIYCKSCPGVKAFNCKGCREVKGQILKFPVCKTYECVMSKGYDFCYECEEFPCEHSKVYNSVMMQKLGLEEWNKVCDEKTTLYYEGRKVRYGGDPLTLEKKDPNMYKKKE